MDLCQSKKFNVFKNHIHVTLFTIIYKLVRSNRRLCSAFDMLAIDEQRATCNMPCVKKCYFPHAGGVSTKHLQSSSVSNVIRAVTAFFLRFTNWRVL